MFDRVSRYHADGNAENVAADGTRYAYKRQRFLPQTEGDATAIAQTEVVGANDPLAFWRLADANDAMDPFAPAELACQLMAPAVGLGGTKRP